MITSSSFLKHCEKKGKYVSSMDHPILAKLRYFGSRATISTLVSHSVHKSFKKASDSSFLLSFLATWPMLASN
jgi:hypothetical protein